MRLRRFQLGDSGGRRCAVIFFKGLVDSDRVEEAIVRPLITWSYAAEKVGGNQTRLRDICDRFVVASDAKQVTNAHEASDAVLSGDVLFVFEGDREGLAVSNPGGQARGVQDPILEVTLRGPRDSFTETLFINTSLIRRRVRDPHLRVAIQEIGTRSKTSVALLYIEGITPETLVNEIERRLDGIELDGVLDTGYIEHLIEDEWWSPFPQHLKTERPDKAVAGLYEGRAVLIADTTPFALIMPTTFDSYFHSPEDSYDRWLPVNLLRVVRFIAALTSLVAPSLYVAFVAFHPGTLPTQFLLRVKAAREGVAFPILVEALLMMFFLELIKEAGFRLPSPIGQVFGIVGGLVLSDIGVRAGIVSEAMVIVIAITAISSFSAVDREMGTVLRLLGLPILISTSILGLPGLVLALILIATHLSILRSYGVPYLMPYPYFRIGDMRDTVFAAPMHHRQERPKHLGAKDKRRLRKSKEVADSKDEKGGSR